jgi:hypothetical protein
MQIFSKETELEMREEIIALVSKTVSSQLESTQTKFLKQKQLMEYAGGVSKDTIRKWVAMGLKEIKIDSVVLYDKQDVDEFMAKHKI